MHCTLIRVRTTVSLLVVETQLRDETYYVAFLKTTGDAY